jgi:Uncharacterized conserved protein (DUF2285)
MYTPPLDPPCADQAPTSNVLTGYDQDHLVTYLRLLEADAEGADWTEVARLILQIDPERDPARARRALDSHLARARWMTEHGYRHLLRGTPH